MGRRPNQLIVEFFERGNKLEDASNRYEHTCKRCRQFFPKGRIDSLVGHLLRRCPNVSQIDRETVLSHLQQNASALPHDSQVTRQHDNHSTPPPFVPQLPLDDALYGADEYHSTDLLAFAVQQQSALDTLAEVSRRHLDYSEIQRSAFGFAQEANGIDDGQDLAEQAFVAQLQQASRDTAGSTTTTLLESYTDTASLLQPEQRPDLSLTPQTTHQSPSALIPQLAITSSHGGTPEQQQQGDVNAPIDPLLDADDTPYVFTDTHDHIATGDIMSWNPTNQTGRQTFGALSAPSSELTPGFGLLSTKTKARARGRFSDTRRKEVQEIRKRGACIRCRMLKKPCSEGTPCTTCAHTRSARLWKIKCLRTRLADEFGLWSTGLFHAKASLEVSLALPGTYQLALPGRLEARFFSSNDLCMSFPVKQYGDSPEVTRVLDLSASSANETSSIWLLDDGESVCDKLDTYINQVASTTAEADKLSFMGVTVQRALAVMQDEHAQSLSMSNPQSGSRSCYNFQNELLRASHELWVATSILSGSHIADLQLRYEAVKVAQYQPESVAWNAQAVPAGSRTYNLIKSQLLAALESRCSRLARIVVNELERRLLQRQQVSRFATLISAVLLLNSVERLTGYYRRFDGAMESSSSNTTFNAWLLDVPPSKLWPQGEHFADLLVMLLRMRALPPDIITKPDGSLAVAQSMSAPIRPGRKSALPQADGQPTAMSAWLDPLELIIADLVAKRDGPSPAPDSQPEVWDMRFIARLLVPKSHDALPETPAWPPNMA